MDFEIITADYHRNGSGGEGFYTGVFVTNDEPAGPKHFLMTVFPPEGATSAGRDTLLWNDRWERVSVLRLEDIASHNIFMFPKPDIGSGYKGGAALRGADHYQRVAKALVVTVLDRMDRELPAVATSIKSSLAARRG